MRAGTLTVIAGSMFSGKSTELLRQGRRHTRAGKRGLYVKPKLDNRYSEGEIVTHDDDRMAAFLMDQPNEIIDYLSSRPFDLLPRIVLIDEAQFFDRTMLGVIDQLLQSGIHVYVAGLDMDRYGLPFGIMPHLMAIADEVLKLHAICPECGEEAYVSFGTFSADDQVVVGGAEKYKPLCRRCWYTKRFTNGGPTHV